LIVSLLTFECGCELGHEPGRHPETGEPGVIPRPIPCATHVPSALDPDARWSPAGLVVADLQVLAVRPQQPLISRPSDSALAAEARRKFTDPT
jgi:hypothetical protein